MANKEATARIKINKFLEAAGWRFFPDSNGPANICLELNVKLKEKELNGLGENFEATKKGFIDFLLLNEKGFPSSFWKPRPRTRTHSWARSRRAGTPALKIAAL